MKTRGSRSGNTKSAGRSYSHKQTGEIRRHRGDFMSTETRSALMSRIRGKDTGPERAVAGILLKLGLQPEYHARDLPGRPDLVLRSLRIAIFVDGDFWHGWRFEEWRLNLSERWGTQDRGQPPS